MTMHLNQGTKPKDLPIKTMFSSWGVMIGDYTLSPDDFNVLVRYVLTNADLDPDDKRIELVEQIKKIKIVEGFNTHNDPDVKKYVFETEEELSKHEQNERKIDEEWEKFLDNHSSYLQQYKGKYIAIKGEKVVDVDDDELQLIKRIDKKYPDVPILITKVDEGLDIDVSG